jgi:hypothetical protein
MNGPNVIVTSTLPRIRKTAAVRRGLKVLVELLKTNAVADDAAPRWTNREWDEITRALRWLQQESLP